MLTLADRLTLARLALAPVVVVCYLLLPPPWVWWTCGILCGLAELTDWLDGKVARMRGETSDFGKLADPFCDVFYRMAVMLAMLLPAGGVGIPAIRVPEAWQLAVSVDGAAPALGLLPFLPVFLMILREIVAGALRAMTATRGLVLAARWSGKAKAWLQGATIITALAFPAVFGGPVAWMLHTAAAAAWVCAVVSTYSICEYIWINRAVLRALAERKVG